MPLDDVLDCLKKRPDEWLTTNDIARAIGLTNGSVARLLDRLIGRKLVISKYEYDFRAKSGTRKIRFWRLKWKNCQK